MSLDIPFQYQSQILTSVVERLSLVSSLEEITQIVADAARSLTGSDGATFVLKDGSKCYYVDENSISPLWKGRRFANSTAVALQNLNLKQSLQQQNEGNAEFKDRAQELEAAICSVAHDLRSPLAAMLGLAELLSLHLRESSDEKMKIYLKSLLQTGQQASAQVTKLLSLYKVSKAKTEQKRLDLTSVANEVVRALSLQYPHRKIEFQVDKGLSPLGDEMLIKLVIENLISNALKYSSRKPKATHPTGPLSILHFRIKYP